MCRVLHYSCDVNAAVADSLIYDTSLVKFSRKCDQFFQRYEANCGKVSISQCLKNPAIPRSDSRSR